MYVSYSFPRETVTMDTDRYPGFATPDYFPMPGFIDYSLYIVTGGNQRSGGIRYSKSSCISLCPLYIDVVSNGTLATTTRRVSLTGGYWLFLL